MSKPRKWMLLVVAGVMVVGCSSGRHTTLKVVPTAVTDVCAPQAPPGVVLPANLPPNLACGPQITAPAGQSVTTTTTPAVTK